MATIWLHLASIAVVALVRVLLAMFFVIVSSASVVPILIAAGLMLAGGVYFAYLIKFQPEVLTHEPGKADLF